MAEIYLAATTTTLQRMMSDVRSRVGIVGKRRMAIIEGQLESLIHDAICWVRTTAGAMVDESYRTTVTLSPIVVEVNESFYVINDLDITRDGSALEAFDVVAGKRIDIMSSQSYYDRIAFDKGLPEFRRARIAHLTSSVINDAVGDTKRRLVVYFGDDVMPPGAPGYNLKVTYPRNPVRQTAVLKLVDCPESLVPIAKDFAITNAFRNLKLSPPVEEEGRVNSFNKYFSQSVAQDMVS